MSNELQPNFIAADAPAEAKIPPQRLSPPNNSANDSDTPQPAKRKRGRFWKGLGVFLLAVGATAYGYFNHTTAGIEQRKFANTYIPIIYGAYHNPNKIFDDVNSDHFNILLVGRDVNWKIGKVYDPRTKTYRPYQVIDKDTPARSDTMIVMSLNKTTGSIRMISLPRDARVNLPHNKEGVHRAKLNAAHAYGGVDLLKQTLHDELGLTIHRYAVIKFEGFKKLIDEVGGIYVDVIGPVTRDGKRKDLIYDDNWGNLHIHLKPGKQWLDGQKAHDYVRYRMDLEGDTSRIRRQQSVMRALARRLKEMPMTKLPSVVEEIRQQFETDMSDEELAAAGLFAKNVTAGGQIQPVTLFGVFSTRGSLTLNRPKNEMLLRTVFGSTFDAKRFLVDSPSTDEDEIGPENNASPETLELLREAGIIKGGAPSHPATEAALNDSDSGQTSISEITPESSLPMNQAPASNPPMIASNDLSVESGAPSDEPAPPRRSRRRQRDDQVSVANSSSEEERPRRRRRAEPEAPAMDTGEAPHELSVESPIPQPEADVSSSQPSSSEESPIPRPA